MISIVIPALREENYIADTVRQFEALTLPHEVIVADGKSDDRTVEEARAVGAKVVISEGLRSPSRQRNQGARIASGDILLFIDSSVRIPDINVFLRKATAHLENGAVGLALPQRIYPEIETLTDKIILIITNFNLSLQKIGSGKFIMAKREAFERIGGFREDLIAGEDHDIFRRLAKIGRVDFDRSLTVFYSGRREHALGWPRVLWTWTVDGLWHTFFHRSRSKEWTAVR